MITDIGSLVAIIISILTFVVATFQTFRKAGTERVDHIEERVKDLEERLKVCEQFRANLLSENISLMRQITQMKV